MQKLVITTSVSIWLSILSPFVPFRRPMFCPIMHEVPHHQWKEVVCKVDRAPGNLKVMSGACAWPAVIGHRYAKWYEGSKAADSALARLVHADFGPQEARRADTLMYQELSICSADAAGTGWGCAEWGGSPAEANQHAHHQPRQGAGNANQH